jgi:DNA-binding NarL/FixJ family response regulator
MPITVSIVEDNDQLRATLARLISRSEGFQCLSHFPTAEAALQALPAQPPEVVLVDINLPGINGVEFVRRLKQAAPAILAVMLTAYEDTENIFNALAAGAAGYLLKRAPRSELLEAIREVRRGGSPMTTHIARKVVQSFQKPAPAAQPADAGDTLSTREQEVLNLPSQGFFYKEIADKLGIS